MSLKILKPRKIYKFDSSFYRVICIILMLCSLLEIAPLQIGFSITPEDMRFASMRCQNDYPHANIVFSRYDTSSDNRDTHCYVKCLLRRLGIIELSTLGLDMDRLLEVWDNINLEVKVECTSLSYLLDGTCHSYYRVFQTFRRKCLTLFKSTFHEITPYERIPFKNPPPQWKNIGVAATEFCDSIMIKMNVGANTLPVNAANLKKPYESNIACIFKHFHYFDAYGRIDESEIVRSFTEANGLSPENSKIIKNCVRRANSLFREGSEPEDPQMAFELKTCLTKQCNGFKHVFLHRDNITRYF